MFYPERFRDQVEQVLSIQGKRERGEAKSALLRDVVAWTLDNEAEARTAWEESASEQIGLLREIKTGLGL